MLKNDTWNLDKAVEALDRFVERIDSYLDDPFSEADTRVKFIDPLLSQVLGWEELPNIRRELRYTEDEDRRCIDYVLSLAKPTLVVEAKRNLRDFDVSASCTRLWYKLSASVKLWRGAWDAVIQARQYCDDNGIRYALVTNGRQFVAFKAISEVGPWRDGRALVIPSLDHLRKNLSVFCECLSRDTIALDRLSQYAYPRTETPFRDKPCSVLPSGQTGHRNNLHDVVSRAFSEILLDLPKDSAEFLRECYCTSPDTLRYGGQLRSILEDRIPFFSAPIHAVRPGHKKDPFERTLAERARTPLVVVMGGAGAGKTSFLHWFFEVHHQATPPERQVAVFVDYREIECSADELHGRTLDEIVRTLYTLTPDVTSSFEQLRQIFRDQIDRALAGALRPYADDPAARDKKVSDLIASLQANRLEHLKSLAAYLQDHCHRSIIIVLDNMDQKDDELQARLVQSAHELVYRCGLMVVVALRESTYFRLNRSRRMDAFSHLDFHVRSQSLAAVLDKRLAFLKRKLGGESLKFTAASGAEIDVASFDRFLGLLAQSLLRSPEAEAIVECLEAVCNGNIREELGMLYSFLVSGQTKMEDYFWKYIAAAHSYIPFHEFLHSVIMEDMRIYQEALGRKFLNVFQPSGGKVASHYTTLRILHFFEALGQTGGLRESDFLGFDAIHAEFANVGFAASDIEFHLGRLAEYGLLMRLLPSESAIRDDRFALTVGGHYYLRKLYAEFSYFSSVVSDTTLFDPSVWQRCSDILRKHVGAPKLPIRIRLELAEAFVEYLSEAERREVDTGSFSSHSVFGGLRFVPRMRGELERVKKRVRGAETRRQD